VNVAYLIVGQGIAGSLLAYELHKSGKRVFILNEEKENTSSNKAAGIYNPITGRKMVKTWMADELFELLEPYYISLEKELSARFLYPKPIYRPFYNYEEQNDWSAKVNETGYASFIQDFHTKSQGVEGVIDPVGGLMLKNSGFVHIPEMIKSIRNYFMDLGLYHSEVFSFDKLKMTGTSLTYGELTAEKVIFCEGPDVVKNPFWSELPFRLVKGEILKIDADLSEDTILNRGVFVLPKDGHFHVGSTYDHKTLDFEPSDEGIRQLQDRLTKLFDSSYTLVGSTAGVRPATYDRRPFLGFHPDNEQIGIFNGFGTKGVSLVPYFARHFVNYLNGASALSEDVDVKRCNK
jgi:glycine/D-amino acid oxidase-like deaminating enzyme